MNSINELRQQAMEAEMAQFDKLMDAQPGDIVQLPDGHAPQNQKPVAIAQQEQAANKNMPAINNLARSQNFLRKSIGTRWDKKDEKYAFDLLENLYLKAKKNNKLMQGIIDDQDGLARCISLAMQYKFELSNKDQYHILPYKTKSGSYQLNFQFGYPGILTLCYRAGLDIVNVREVRENDFFEYEYGLRPYLKHIPCKGDRGKIIEFYAILDNKFFEVMTKEECLAHGLKYSKSFNYSDSGWQTDPDGMCKKTVLLKVCNYYPKTTNISRDTIDAEILEDTRPDTPALPSS